MESMRKTEETLESGKLLSEGKCCWEQSITSQTLIKPLSKLKKDDKGVIAHIHTTNKEMLRKIMALGALPGLSIKLLRDFPSCVFQIGESQFAIDKNMAEHIQVRI